MGRNSRNTRLTVITGDDRGPEVRKVLRALPARGKILVEGVNRVYKHLKPTRQNPQGGRLSKEMPIDVSNVLFQSARADYLEVLTTRRDSLDSQMELIETRLRQMHALVNIYQALGGGWRS